MQAVEILDDDDDLMEVCVPAVDDDDEIFNTVRFRRCISHSKHQQMIAHVMWPRKLPWKENEAVCQAPFIALMTDTSEFLESSLDCLAGSSKLLRGMFNTTTSNASEVIAAEINRLRPGNMFGYFVKEQNCGFSVYVQPVDDDGDEAAPPKSAIVSTFQLSIPNEEIYAAEHNDFQVRGGFEFQSLGRLSIFFFHFLQMEFPTQSVMVDFSTMLNSIEFSEQLIYLDRNVIFNETEGEVCPSYVSQWLVPMLSTAENVVLRQFEFPVISKKIRDVALGTKLHPPFRRSTFWTFLKAILQMNLTIVLGEVSGKVVYKLVMMRVLATLCNVFNSDDMYESLSVDVVLLCLAKLARRIEKLDNLVSSMDKDGTDTLPNGFDDAYSVVLNESKLVIFKVREKLDRQVCRIQSSDEHRSTLTPLCDLNFETDVQQKLPKLRKYLGRQIQPPEDSYNGKVKLKSHLRVPGGMAQVPNVDDFDKLKHPTDIGIYLYDFENWILYDLHDTNLCTPESLRSWSFAYERLAVKHYHGDPLSFSRMILTLLKILKLLDRIATVVHKELKKHEPGIRQEVFDNLLLPQYEDFEIAHDLKLYFRKRSDQARYPSLVGEEKVSEDSFSHRFAKNSEEMQEVLARIDESADATISRISQEYEKKRKEVADLRKRSEGMQCEYVFNANGKRQHKDACPSCKLTRKISGIRVTTFEMPLPVEKCDRNAIVFELRIPVEIACLRDVLYRIVVLLNEPPKKVRTFEKWIKSDALCEYDQSTSECVFLVSTVKGKSVGRTRHRGKSAFSSFHESLLW